MLGIAWMLGGGSHRKTTFPALVRWCIPDMQIHAGGDHMSGGDNGPARPRNGASGRWMVFVVICLIALAFLILDNLQGFPKVTAQPEDGGYPDATVYISTLIVVYAALITVQGL